MKNIKYLLIVLGCCLLVHCKKSTKEILPPEVMTGVYFPEIKIVKGGIINHSENLTTYGHVWDTVPAPEVGGLSSTYNYQGYNGDTLEVITEVNFTEGTTYYIRGYAQDKFDNIFYGQYEIIYDSNNPTACFTASRSICETETCSVNFDASCSTPENFIATYKWDVNGDGVFDFSGADKQNISYLYDTAGTYIVKLEIRTSTGITADTTYTIQVYDIVADFDIPGGIIYEGCEVAFTNNSTGATSYLWNFGDGNTSMEENPIHTYENPGNYAVTLTAMMEGVETESMQNININPTIKFEKIRDDGSTDTYNDVIALSDGNYVIAGYTTSQGVGANDVYLIKTDANGNMIWEKTFGGSNVDVANSIASASDGGYVLAGETRSQGAGANDVYLIKTDANGNMEWEKTFGGIAIDIASSIISAPDGGYILSGETWSQGAGESDIYLIKTDANGNLQWERTFGGSIKDEANSIVSAPSGGYVIAGTTTSQGAGSNDVYLIKTDTNGDLEWEKTFGGSSYDEANSIISAPSGGYVIAGTTMSQGAGSNDVYLIKTDANGDLEWEKTFGGSSSDWAVSIVSAPDSGYVIAGYTASQGAGALDVYLIKTNANGDLEWEKTFGGSNSDYGHSVKTTNDCGYIIAGKYNNGSNDDFYLIKTDSEGNTQ